MLTAVEIVDLGEKVEKNTFSYDEYKHNGGRLNEDYFNVVRDLFQDPQEIPVNSRSHEYLQAKGMEQFSRVPLLEKEVFLYCALRTDGIQRFGTREPLQGTPSILSDQQVMGEVLALTQNPQLNQFKKMYPLVFSNII